PCRLPHLLLSPHPARAGLEGARVHRAREGLRPQGRLRRRAEPDQAVAREAPPLRERFRALGALLRALEAGHRTAFVPHRATPFCLTNGGGLGGAFAATRSRPSAARTRCERNCALARSHVQPAATRRQRSRSSASAATAALPRSSSSTPVTPGATT